jgi:hypothetical protein
MKRTWSSCGSHQLEHLLQSTKSAATVVDATLRRNAPIHRVPAATAEAVQNGAANKAAAGGGGRTLQDAIIVTDENNNNDSSERGNGGGATDLSWEQAAAISVLQTPLHWMEPPTLAEQNADPSSTNATRASSFSQQPSRALVLTSGNQEMSSKAANSMRLYLELRTQCQNESMQIRSMQRSMQHQHDTLARLEREQWQSLTARSSAFPSSVDSPEEPTMLDEFQSAQLTAERVVAQLQRQLPLLEAKHTTTLRRMQAARHAALADYAAARSVRQDYRDPVVTATMPPQSLHNRTILNLVHRQVGMDRCLGRSVPRTMGRIRLAGSMVEDRQALLYHRFSHAATINTHLSYPVYCLRLDQTGRYFITGADDYLVKVFCVGGNMIGASSHQRGRLDPALYARGAVLVCTLKGHSGVINDIGVSSDNCFLATASADGDCRVWRLKDGCPVAILRGHLGGANMVRLTLPSWCILLRRPFLLLELTKHHLLGASRYHGQR